MRKIISVLLVCVLVFSSSLLPAYAYEAFEYIKVGLSFGSASVNSFKAATEQNIVVGYVTDRVFTPMMTIEGRDVLVEKGGGTYLVTKHTYADLQEALAGSRELRNQGFEAHGGCIDGAYKVLIGLFDDAPQAEAVKADLDALGILTDVCYLDMKTVMVQAGYNYIVFRNATDSFAFGSDGFAATRVDGKSYRGYIVADRINSSAIAIVNLVDFDDYTAAVVGSEMYASWHIEALKAQAVVARTYAATVKSYKSYGIDVTDDTRTQAYNGVQSETASTRRAAQETSGRLVLYKGNPAQTYFTSSSGGTTADVYSAWGGGAGLDYLKSVEDTYEDTQNIPNGIWEYTYTPEQIKAKLATKNIDIGDIVNIYVADRGEDKRVRKLTVVGTSGTHTLTFDSCRTFFGLKSQYYYVQTPIKTKLYAIGHKEEQSVENSPAVLTASGLAKTGDTLYVLGADGVQKTEQNSNENYTFSGRGYGHGVGLSQYGAKGMAEAGFTYDEIIAHYYPGTTLSEASEELD